MNCSGASLLRLRLRQQLHRFTPASTPSPSSAANTRSRLPRQGQHVCIRLLSTASLHIQIQIQTQIQPVLSPGTIRLPTLPSSRRLYTYASPSASCSLCTAQTSRFQPFIQAHKTLSGPLGPAGAIAPIRSCGCGGKISILLPAKYRNRSCSRLCSKNLACAHTPQ